MLKQIVQCNNTKIGHVAIRQFSTSSIILAGRQTGSRRKAEKKYDVDFMPTFDFDDQTTIGHNLFENIRHVRQYLRKTEYELPKLSAFAKPFEPPKENEILKFKTHTYLGEGHPVERKVVLSVKVDDLGLNETEKHKFLLLSGPRYNVNTEELIISCERFPRRKQNKKFIMDTLQKLIKEAKDTKDTFADIPLNLPKPKQRLEFPKEWIRSPVTASEESPVISTEKTAQVFEEIAETASTKHNVIIDEKTVQ
ncbi:mitochondrial ribosomal subunit protein-domain-containing protein [Cokeromyces recurvatus]|uniref:mitochondrial ribosomal subunit protein-domain-containing protein n=1 Tax=Cokeromyces recurvatus TaxID=90255 RepID=UPI00221E5118|nr:mitochondrial ribosomal subunit protein-domain-containing protein [Cokeromyces recurvatus]KAI7898968.1 mitochondrial ribosomal subunit protein-domain-containing protein [Cokeromyces recurvatus]